MFDGISDIVKSAAQTLGGTIGGPIGAMIGGMLADFAIQTIGDQLDQSLSNANLPFDAQSLFSGQYMKAFQGALRG